MEDIKRISVGDKEYPRLLKKIKNPPKVLYLKGKILADEPCFAVVGTRMFSSYGKQVAIEITSGLCEAGLTVVSGLAPGIDTIAHQTALEERKRTIAVLGTGLDEKSIYPKSNIGLAGKIVETGGCLISEYPIGTRGTRFTFPQRNRIISGLSLGVLVVEAKQRSGALITAEWARTQGRKIFAVPGNIYSLNSKGPHLLIKQGVKLVDSANDILNELNFKSRIMNKGNIITGGNEEEQLILEALKEEAFDIDNIIEKTKLSAKRATATLAILEIRGKVKNLGGNIYTINR